MKDVILQVLKEERSAENRLESARKEAENIISEAKKKVQSLIEESRRKTSAEVAQRKIEMEQAFLEEKENILRAVLAESNAVRQNKKEDIPKIASQIFQKIIMIDEQSDSLPEKQVVKSGK